MRFGARKVNDVVYIFLPVVFVILSFIFVDIMQGNYEKPHQGNQYENNFVRKDFITFMWP